MYKGGRAVKPVYGSMPQPFWMAMTFSWNDLDESPPSLSLYLKVRALRPVSVNGPGRPQGRSDISVKWTEGPYGDSVKLFLCEEVIKNSDIIINAMNSPVFQTVSSIMKTIFRRGPRRQGKKGFILPHLQVRWKKPGSWSSSTPLPGGNYRW